MREIPMATRLPDRLGSPLVGSVAMATAPPSRPEEGPSRKPRIPFRGSKPAEGEQPPGWHVEPAPDGRGAPKPPRQGWMPGGRARLLLIIVALFALNAWVVSTFPDEKTRIDIPYFPT